MGEAWTHRQQGCHPKGGGAPDLAWSCIPVETRRRRRGLGLSLVASGCFSVSLNPHCQSNSFRAESSDVADGSREWHKSPISQRADAVSH